MTMTPVKDFRRFRFHFRSCWASIYQPTDRAATRTTISQEGCPAMILDYPCADVTRATFAKSILDGRDIQCDLRLNFRDSETGQAVHRITVDDKEALRA